jgi:hypothetical protein
MRGDAAVEKASVQLARQLAGVTESRREALRDRCRAHFAHGGQVWTPTVQQHTHLLSSLLITTIMPRIGFIAG